MRKKALTKNIFSEMRKTRSRFISIFAIVAIGVSFFGGLTAAAPDMRTTVDVFADNSELMDFRLVSTFGFTDNDVDALQPLVAEGATVMPAYFYDAILSSRNGDDVVRIMSLCNLKEQNPLNKLTLTEGRLPERADECLIDSTNWSDEAIHIGDTVTIKSDTDTDISEVMSCTEYTVTGLFSSAMYINKIARGSTTVGNGAIDLVMYIPAESFCIDYYTEIYVSMPDLKELNCSSAEYDELAAYYRKELETIGDSRELDRYDEVITEANEKIADGEKELSEQKEKAYKELADAKAELDDAKKQLDDAKAKIDDGEAQLADAKVTLADSRTQLDDGWAEYYNGKSEFEDKILSGTQELTDGVNQLLDGDMAYIDNYEKYSDGELQYAQGLAKYENGLYLYEQGLAQYNEKLAEFEDGKKQFEDAEKQLADGLAAYDEGAKKLADGKAKYYAGMAQYQDGYAQYSDGLARYNDGARQLADARAELDSGWKQYNEGVSQAAQLKEYSELLALLFDLTPTLKDIVSGSDAALTALDELIAQYGSLYEIAEKAIAYYEENFGELAGKDAILEAAKSTADKNASYRKVAAELLKLGDSLLAEADELKETVENLDTTLSDAKAKLDDGEVKYTAAKAELDAGKPALDAAKVQLDDAYSQLSAAKVEIDAGEKQLTDSKALLDAGKAQLEENRALIVDGEKQLVDGKKTLDDSKAQLDEGKTQLDESRVTLDDAKAQLADAKQQLLDAREPLSSGSQELYDGLSEGMDKLTESYNTLNDAETKYREGYAEYKQSLSDMEDGKVEYADGLVKYEDGLKQYNEGKAEADSKLADAEEELAKAKNELADLDNPVWYVFDRADNPGFSEYLDNADRINNIASVFPVFFLLVAVLVCLTTMTRMVEEQRTQIGTLKALGYGNADIITKFLVYAVSATLLGSIVGNLAGMKMFPFVIMAAYSMLYSIPNIELPYYLDIASVATVIFCAAIALTVFLSCRTELREHPSQLMRPKAPKLGKRILIERITPIWKHVGFTQKVTIRNIFRYKRRMLMTVIGIAGCTALTLTGFALRDSINGIIVKQFGEIMLYDGMAAVESNDHTTVELQQLLSDNGADYMQLYQKQVDVEFGEKKQQAYITVPLENEMLNDFLVTKGRLDKQRYTLDDNTVMIDEKLSILMGLKVGDEIELYTSETVVRTVKIGYIFENYANHFVYMSSTLYRELYAADPEYNIVIFKTGLEGEAADSLNEQILDIDGVQTIMSIADTRITFDNMLKSLDAVIIVIIVAAGALAFVVLYNLTNINITERIREISTLKVLGFFDMEVDGYVFRENILLTLMGTAVGLIMGVFLANFIITTSEIDTVMFAREIHAPSYIFAAVITLGFSLIVSAFMHKHLVRIDMVEALKSVE